MKAHYQASSTLGSSNTQSHTVDVSKIISDMRGVGLSIDQLQQETDFLSYLKLLQPFSKRYTLLISVNDTPCGPAFTEEMARLLMNLGLEADLSKCYRYSYIAVIDAGKRLVERASNKEAVSWQGNINNCKIELVSIGYDITSCQHPLLQINGQNYAAQSRGINFVLLDAVTETVLDSCIFDTYATIIPCIRSESMELQLRGFVQRNPDINLICLATPEFPTSNLSKNEEDITNNFRSFESCYSHMDCIPALNKYFHSSRDILEVLTPPPSFCDIYGVRRFENQSGKYVNTANGIRLTTNQVQKHKRSIFIVGGCTVFGVGSSDSNTVASFLQRELNRLVPEYEFNVYNYGYFLGGSTVNYSKEICKILNFIPVQSGDIVLFSSNPSDDVPFCDLSKAAQRPHPYGEVFFDKSHYTADGNHLIANKLFDYLQQNDFFKRYDGKSPLQPVHSLPNVDNGKSGSTELQGLEEYKTILKNFYNSMFQMKFGAVVMNCNPFTLGHRYLIEQALKQCDYLMIFVVQEDKSFFSFDDRLKMVEDGTQDLKNVAVIPSGNFVLSAMTFSEYFNKEELQKRKVDTSLDVTLFAREIAPCLHISVRFAGEEPFDNITQQYNDSMRAILPQYGIDFVEIPRAEQNGVPISASHVRKLLEEKNFSSLSALVPQTTLEFLQKRFQ